MLLATWTRGFSPLDRKSDFYARTRAACNRGIQYESGKVGSLNYLFTAPLNDHSVMLGFGSNLLIPGIKKT